MSSEYTKETEDTKVLFSMKVEDLKWYSPFVLLVGAILSFADPITDILTLVEFYRADHKTWFGVGLAFVILPCFVFLILYFFNFMAYIKSIDSEYYSCTGICTQTILCGFNPFSAACLRLQGFVYCLMKWWRGEEIDSADKDEAVDLLGHIDYVVLMESVLESAPQFILQLYAVSVQDEPVEIIQIISLPVSFLSLAWAFTTADELLHGEVLDDLKIKHKLVLFVAHILLLSSRLFAVCYFTVSYKWWVVGVLLFHTSAITITDTIWLCREGECNFAIGFMNLALFLCLNWLRDDTSAVIQLLESENTKITRKRMQLFSNVLFVLENFVMILLFYCEHSNNWYSLPVTVCVCLFSVLGSVMRVIHFRVLLNTIFSYAVNP